MSESGTFEPAGGYLGHEGAPPAKRPRFGFLGENGSLGHDGEEIVSVEASCEGQEVEVEGEEAAVQTITVPQTQFEIEINSSQPPEEEVEVEDEELQTHDLSGPAFTVIQGAQELAPLDATPLKSAIDPEGGGVLSDDSTLNAIGRALIQMQQQQQQLAAASQPQATGTASQLIISSTQGSVGEGGQVAGAPLYVMIPPSSSAEILQAMGQSRPIVPKLGSPNGSPVLEGGRKNREQQRKATHNEVERRRRDRINDLIKTLAQVVPGCQKKDTATGNIVGYVYSKGTVLDKTVEHLRDLRAQNEQLAGTAKLAEKSANALSILQNQITVLEKENAFLRAQIIQLGLDAANNATGNSSNFNRQLLATPLAQSLLNTTVAMPTSLSGPTHQSAAHQLLLSLAQSLTNSSLLTSSPPSAPALPASASPPARLTPSQLSTLTSPLVGGAAASLASQFGAGSLPMASPNTALSSLVQTLASIASTTTTQANPLPKVALPPTLQPQQTALSASAASNLLAQLNTLLVAQGVLTGAGSSAGGGVSLTASPGLSSSVLSSVGMETVSTEHTSQ